MLKVISHSAFTLQPVLDTLVETAARLCNGDSAGLTNREGELYRYVAIYALADEFYTLLRNRTFTPGRGTIAGRTALEGKVVHVADLAADAEYTMPEAVTVAKIRTCLGAIWARPNSRKSPSLSESIRCRSASLAQAKPAARAQPPSASTPPRLSIVVLPLH